MRILHVTECFGAGVGQAVRTAIRLLPEHEHHLIWSGEDTPEESLGLSSSAPLGRSPLSRITQIRRAVRLIQPDVLHAHSSWAGVFSRVIPQSVPVIYQPHAYAFENLNWSAPLRWAFRSAEAYFARNTDLVIALSDAEERVATGLSGSTPVARLSNASLLRPPHVIPRPFPSSGATLEVVMIGRIGVQKDPEFFSRVAAAVRSRRPETRFTWIGDGDPALRIALEEHGVEVTGWLSRDQLAARLAHATAYFHSASYEGFPLSVLDAAAFALPIVVRDIPAFNSVDLVKGRDVQSCASALAQTLMDSQTWERSLKHTIELDDQMHPSGHAKKLDELYRLVTGSSARISLGGTPVSQMDSFKRVAS